MPKRLFSAAFLCAMAVWGQSYSGPRPAKPDVPYLLHAENLVETEVSEAKEQSAKDQTIYVVAGANSPARTPLASPIFLLRAEKLAPEKLRLFQFEVKNGQRQVLFSRKKKVVARPIRLSFRQLAPDLYRIEADESLAKGEYSLTPDGTNEVFCFQVF